MNFSLGPQLDGMQLKEYRFPFPGRELRILALAEPAGIVGLSEGDPLPEIYWGEIWPAGMAMAQALINGTLQIPDGVESVVDLGCGSGVVAVAAACVCRGRATVLATDREPRALTLARMNADLNEVSASVVVRGVDWRKPYALRHPLILAADCIYHPDSVPLILDFLKRSLAPSPAARAVLADPGRWAARDFRYHALQAGFSVSVSQHLAPFTAVQGPIAWFPQSGPPTDSDQPITDAGVNITFYELRWPQDKALDGRWSPQMNTDER